MQARFIGETPCGDCSKGFYRGVGTCARRFVDAGFASDDAYRAVAAPGLGPETRLWVCKLGHHYAEDTAAPPDPPHLGVSGGQRGFHTGFMRTPLPPPPRQLQAGVSLIVAVLGISIFLLILIGVSLALSVNSRQTVADHGEVLTAQYAAENAVTQVQMRVRVAEQAMNTLYIPRGVTARDFYDDMRALCGGAATGTFQSWVPNTADSHSVVYLDRDPADDRENWQRAGQVMCSFNPGQGIAAAGLLGKLNYYKVVRDGQPDLEGAAALAPLLGMSPTEAQLATFWQTVFSGHGRGTVNYSVGGAQATATHGLQPVQLVRLGFSWYRLVFESGEVTAQGAGPRSRRALHVAGNPARYYLDLRQDSFARYALFTDHHYTNPAAESATSGGGNIWFTDNTRFNGPVHTNQTFNFTRQFTDGLGATFGGRVTSAGCARNQLRANECRSYERGARFNDRRSDAQQFRTADQIDPDPTSQNSPSRNQSVRVTQNNIATDFRQGIDLRAEWIQLPQNVNDQRALARNIDPFEGTGLSFGGNVDRMELRSLRAASPARDFQYLSATVGTNTTRLMIDDQKRTYLCMATTHNPLRPSESFSTGALGTIPACRWVRATKTATGGNWVEARVAEPNTIPAFNGVIHVAGDVRWLGGPDRTRQPNANSPAMVGTHVPAAVAAHAQLNITANRDINIYRDLKYEQDPRTTPGATNVLGLFSAGVPNSGTNRLEGFINLMGDTGEPDSVRRSCNSDGVSCTTAQTLAQQASGYVQNDSAPNDLSVDATMLASFGSVRVNGHGRGDPRGQMHLLGGIIEQYYGPFGTFGTVNGRCLRSWGNWCLEYEQIPYNRGYGRNYDYDTRFDDGLAPPGFPTQPVWNREVNVQPGAQGHPENASGSFAQLGYWRQVRP